MEATQFFLNDQLVTITADSHTIKRLNDDDHYLADYINKAAKSGQFHFLFTKDPTLRRITVKRIPTTFTPVWYKKGRPTEADLAASLLLLKLCNSDKFALRFQDGHSLKNQLWDEIAREMKISGYEVDGYKCSQKFQQLTQNYEKNCYDITPEMCGELKKIHGEKKTESDDDEEWLPRSMKKRKTVADEDEGDFIKKILKKNYEMKDVRFKELCGLMKKRNELYEEKLKQNQQVIDIMEKMLKK